MRAPWWLPRALERMVVGRPDGEVRFPLGCYGCGATYNAADPAETLRHTHHPDAIGAQRSPSLERAAGSDRSGLLNALDRAQRERDRYARAALALARGNVERLHVAIRRDQHG